MLSSLAHRKPSTMRSYPIDSPAAAARIVTLAMLADGEVSGVETETLKLSAEQTPFGLHADEWDLVALELRADLREAAPTSWTDACQVEPSKLADLLSEIVDPKLRLQVVRLCVAVVESDGHVETAEATLLESAVEQWCLHREMLRPNCAVPLDRLPARRSLHHG